MKDKVINKVKKVINRKVGSYEQANTKVINRFINNKRRFINQ